MLAKIKKRKNSEGERNLVTSLTGNSKNTNRHAFSKKKATGPGGKQARQIGKSKFWRSCPTKESAIVARMQKLPPTWVAQGNRGKTRQTESGI